jgi:transposase
MEVLYPRCAGIDVHKKIIVVCRIIPGPDGKPIKEIRTFTTMTRDLLALSDWLAEGGVTHVAMESTGVIAQRAPGSPSTTCSRAVSPSCW